jgi:hypothetical protein
MMPKHALARLHHASLIGFDIREIGGCLLRLRHPRVASPMRALHPWIHRPLLAGSVSSQTAQRGAIHWRGRRFEGHLPSGSVFTLPARSDSSRRSLRADARARRKPLLGTQGRTLQRATHEVHVCSVIWGCWARQVDVGWDANAIEREARQAVRPRGRIHELAPS